MIAPVHDTGKLSHCVGLPKVNVKLVAWTSVNRWKRTTVGRGARRSCMRSRGGIRREEMRHRTEASSKYHGRGVGRAGGGAETEQYNDETKGKVQE